MTHLGRIRFHTYGLVSLARCKVSQFSCMYIALSLAQHVQMALRSLALGKQK